MIRTREPGRKLIGGGEDRFTEDQIAFLQSEFDRQRKLIGSLTERENEALLELERAKGSVSYRIGRVITSPLREGGGCWKQGHRQPPSWEAAALPKPTDI